MRNELLKWCEDLKKSDTIMIAVIDLEAKINSIPVPSVEGYLEGKQILATIGETKCINISDALAALQSLASDKDEEIGKLREALENLVQLKRWKDQYGKGTHYLRYMNNAWRRAFELFPEPPKQ